MQNSSDSFAETIHFVKNGNYFEQQGYVSTEGNSFGHFHQREYNKSNEIPKSA